MPGDPNPYPDHVVRAYYDLRVGGVPQRDAALEVEIPQSRAATWDKKFNLPTSKHPDRRPVGVPDWRGVTTTCPGCGREFEQIHAGQRFCPQTRHKCAQTARRRAARALTG